MSPAVSVIVPAWNAAASLPETLDSVRRQSFTSFEAIIVDDGSTDDTAETARRAIDGDPRFRIIRQANAGVAGARNRALAEARGRYVANLDADDLWRTEFLAKTVAALEAGGPSTAFAFARSAWIDDAGELLADWSGWRPGPVDYREILLRNPVGNGSAALMRTEAVAALGGWDADLVRDFGPAEDWQLLLQLAAQGQVATVDEPLVLYRRSATSASADLGRAVRATHEVLRRRLSQSPRLPRADYWTSRSLGLLWTMRRAREAGQAQLARRLAVRAYLVNPLWFTLPELRAPILRRVVGRGSGRAHAAAARL